MYDFSRFGDSYLYFNLFHFKCISIQERNDNDRHDADHTFNSFEYLYDGDWKRIGFKYTILCVCARAGRVCIHIRIRTLFDHQQIKAIKMPMSHTRFIEEKNTRRRWQL